MSENYDVIVIGTGAGGGTLAHTLAPSGKRSCCWSGGIS
jgi:choline dehydrogenase-like flavoprotein